MFCVPFAHAYLTGQSYAAAVADVGGDGAVCVMDVMPKLGYYRPSDDGVYAKHLGYTLGDLLGQGLRGIAVMDGLNESHAVVIDGDKIVDAHYGDDCALVLRYRDAKCLGFLAAPPA